jgi:hypothetical protein
MVDYSEAFLEMDKNLRLVYEMMLKNKPNEASRLLKRIADVANFTAAWIENEA